MTIDKKFYNLGDIAVCFITVDGVTETVFVPADMTDRLNDEKLAGISPLGWMISPETQVHIALSGARQHAAEQRHGIFSEIQRREIRRTKRKADSYRRL